jgi:hypothetical protein
MMVDPQRPAWVTDEVLAEHEDDVLSELAGRLIAGGRATGLALSANECRILAELVVKRPPRKRAVGRPRDPDRKLDMLLECSHHEYNGASVEAAVAATAKKFGVSRATVFTARKQIESK